ncbi:MAG TPA: hypothetical protein DHW02_19190 [Ktedonobacter sp.]|nr:hypothetical protein [Ktedonobacter sp.]
MNCVRCNMPLETNARFCRNCGLPASVSLEQAQQGTSHIPSQQTDAAATQPSWLPSSPPLQQPTQQWQPTQYAQEQSYPSSVQASYNQSDTPGTFQPAPTQPTKPKRRSRLGGCLLGAFGLLVVLIIGLGAVWVFVARPYLHNIAVQQINNVMSQAVNQIPPQLSQLPPGPVVIQQNALNNLITLNTSPSDPVQHTNAQITPNKLVFDFQIYGQNGTITGVPVAQGGKLILTNATVSGLIGLILSPSDITSIFNQHMADAQARLNHQIVSVQLASQQMTLLLA